MKLHTEASNVGHILRNWRGRRKLSQLALASEADVSTRHLSFLESGRAMGSREMLLRLAEHLEMPLRIRNQLLIAGGYAPVFSEHSINAAEMAPVREAIEALLDAHRPFPGLVIDRQWSMISANDAVTALTEGVAPKLLEPPINVLRLSLHPDGLAPRIENLGEWRAHLLHRLDAQIKGTGDLVLMELREELAGYPVPASPHSPLPANGIAVPLSLWDPVRSETLSFLSTTTVFGTPVDVTLSELMLECFYPADDSTRRILTANASS